MRSRGSVEGTEGAWLPRWSVIPQYFEPAQVYRRILLVGDIFVKNFVGVERSKHVLF